MKDNNYKITIENPEGETMTMTMPFDTHISVWGRIFRTILTWVSFMPSTIAEIIYDDEEL